MCININIKFEDNNNKYWKQNKEKDNDQITWTLLNNN